MTIEKLEGRQLLHSITVSGQTLLITGTAGNDTFVFTSTSTTFTLFPFEDGVAEASQDFSYSAINRIEIRAGAGNDKVNAEQIRFGTRLEGGSGRDTLLGGLAGDRMLGGGSRDILSGNGGNDNLEGNSGPDYLNGGGGRDRVSYAGRASRVFVDLGTPGGDGEAGENDSVASDVETIVGSNFADEIRAGGKRGYNFFGGNGADVLVGGGGNDTLAGGDFVDQLLGNAGNDLLIGNDDTQTGLFAKDQLDGGSGTDTAQASGDDEVINVP